MLNEVAYIDIQNEGKYYIKSKFNYLIDVEFIQTNSEALKLYRLSQYGLQYMLYSVSKLKDNYLVLKDYIQIQQEKEKKMKSLLQAQVLKNQ